MNENPYIAFTAQQLQSMIMDLDLELSTNKLAIDDLIKIGERILEERRLINEALVRAYMGESVV